MTFQDIKNKQIPITTATLIAVLIFAINAAFFVGVQQANMLNRIENNEKDIQAIIQKADLQDKKIETVYNLLNKFFTSTEVIKNSMQTIKEDVQEIKEKVN